MEIVDLRQRALVGVYAERKNGFPALRVVPLVDERDASLMMEKFAVFP